MNGHWNSYCAFAADGSRRGAAYSAAVFRKAFARIYVLLHGGALADVDAKLQRLGLPPTQTGELMANPVSRLRVVWNPQGFGSPDVPGNSAAAYYRGTRTSTSSPTTSTTSAAERSGTRTSGSTTHTRRSRTASASGRTGGSTIRASSRGWRGSFAATVVSNCSPTTTAGRARPGISPTSPAAAPPTGG